MSPSFCLTNTIDNYTDLGHKYYHNIQQQSNRVRMRPRLPLRFDFNDVEVVKMDPTSRKTQLFVNHYREFQDLKHKIDPNNLYRLRRTGFSVFNTFLLYVLSTVLIVASVINMKKIVRTLQNDRSLSVKTKMLFRLSFVFSFIVVLFLCCFLGLSMFELYRNMDLFGSFTTANNFRYKNIKIKDGNLYYLRTMVLAVVCFGILFAAAETVNLFLMKPEKPTILVLFIPILICFLLLINLYNFYEKRNGNVN